MHHGVTFPASEIAARIGLQQLIAQLTDTGVPAQDIGSVEIVLAEAVNNVVEHAYAGREPEDVRVQHKLEGTELTIVIEDTGGPLPGLELPKGNPANLDVPLEDMPEGGFGWFLIRGLTSALRYERGESTNRLTLCFACMEPEE